MPFHKISVLALLVLALSLCACQVIPSVPQPGPSPRGVPVSIAIRHGPVAGREHQNLLYVIAATSLADLQSLAAAAGDTPTVDQCAAAGRVPECWTWDAAPQSSVLVAAVIDDPCREGTSSVSAGLSGTTLTITSTVQRSNNCRAAASVNLRPRLWVLAIPLARLPQEVLDIKVAHAANGSRPDRFMPDGRGVVDARLPLLSPPPPAQRVTEAQSAIALAIAASRARLRAEGYEVVLVGVRRWDGARLDCGETAQGPLSQPQPGYEIVIALAPDGSFAEDYHLAGDQLVDCGPPAP